MYTASPTLSKVGSLIIFFSYLCGEHGIFSVFSSPHSVHINNFVPSFEQVDSFVIVPLSNSCSQLHEVKDNINTKDSINESDFFILFSPHTTSVL